MSEVSRNRGVDFEAPSVDAASHALARFDTLRTQPIRHLQTADAMMAIDDQGCIVSLGFKLLKRCWNRPHGDQFRSFDARLLELEGLPDIDEADFFSGIHAAFDLSGRCFERQVGHAFASSV